MFLRFPGNSRLGVHFLFLSSTNPFLTALPSARVGLPPESYSLAKTVVGDVNIGSQQELMREGAC